MNYNDLIQLYFERTTALQSYWTLYVVIVGGLLAFSSLRKEPSPLTTAIVCLLFALFAYENLSAIRDTGEQRYATLESIRKADSAVTGTGTLRGTLEPTLHPASPGSTIATHLISDILTIAALCAMEFRRPKARGI
ncbi:MAG: hypothetical protein ABI946_08350 [Chthoniobacterales bacterium]